MKCPNCTALVRMPTAVVAGDNLCRPTPPEPELIPRTDNKKALACPICDFWGHEIYWSTIKETPAEKFVPKTHWLKTEPRYFYAHMRGIKPFEVRKNDRNYKVGDLVILEMYSISRGYHGKNLTREITYITDYPDGIKPGYLVLGLKPL